MPLFGWSGSRTRWRRNITGLKARFDRNPEGVERFYQRLPRVDPKAGQPWVWQFWDRRGKIGLAPSSYFLGVLAFDLDGNLGEGGGQGMDQAID